MCKLCVPSQRDPPTNGNGNGGNVGLNEAWDKFEVVLEYFSTKMSLKLNFNCLDTFLKSPKKAKFWRLFGVLC